MACRDVPPSLQLAPIHPFAFAAQACSAFKAPALQAPVDLCPASSTVPCPRCGDYVAQVQSFSSSARPPHGAAFIGGAPAECRLCGMLLF